MKWFTVFIILLLSFSAVSANLYEQHGLELELDVEGSFELKKTAPSGSVSKVSTDLLLVPKEDHRQFVGKFDTKGVVNEDLISFKWDDKKIEEKKFGYEVVVNTQNSRREVKEKILYPFVVPKELQQYLEATEHIDSNHPAIIAKSKELVKDEDDLFKVVFNIANWVEKNVEYDLNTLTSTSSQKASWVLENREGVCDEMTSLFVAMTRAAGIPARFVTGISYTEHPDVLAITDNNNWAGHGWAEVYFPDVGWVSFDITFGEFGYVDVTHIKLRDGFDPADPATKFKWFSNNVNLEAKELSMNVNILQEGKKIEESLQLEQEILSSEVGFGSFNLVKGILKNTADYYSATTLQLIVPQEIGVKGQNKRTILLSPKEVRETYWVLQVPNDLQEGYVYTYPTSIISEKNTKIEDSFKVTKGKKKYSSEEIEDLTVQDEEKAYSRQVSFGCDLSRDISKDSRKEFSCTINNKGNLNLNNVRFCVHDVCKNVDVKAGSVESLSTEVIANKEGWSNIVVSAVSGVIDKRESFEYRVADKPSLVVDIVAPEMVHYGEDFAINIEVDKDSFVSPKNISLSLVGPGFEQKWKIEKLNSKESVEFRAQAIGLSKSNDFEVVTRWVDENGKEYSSSKEFNIKVQGKTFREKMKLLLNSFMNLFR